MIAHRGAPPDGRGGLRGTKANVWEGGHRVPFVVRWPGVVEAESAANVVHTDLYATLADVAGTAPGPDAAEDSVSRAKIAGPATLAGTSARCREP